MRQGRMGWFGMDDATNESIASTREAFQAYLQEGARERTGDYHCGLPHLRKGTVKSRLRAVFLDGRR